MSVSISKWGNSLGIRIPSAIVDALSIKSGDSLTYEVSNDSVILRKKVSTKRLFENFYKKPFSDITTNDLGAVEFMDFGDDVGGEVF